MLGNSSVADRLAASQEGPSFVKWVSWFVRSSFLLGRLCECRQTLFVKKVMHSSKRMYFFWFLGVGWDWVHLVSRPLIGLLYQPRMIADDECGAVGGMRIGRGDRSTRRKPVLVPLCPPRISHDLTWARTRVAAVGSRRLIAWAVTAERIYHYYYLF
jgi:hypothetical protein